MTRRTPRTLPPSSRSSTLSPEERLLAHQAFRYEVGILRAWEDVRRSSTRVADPRTWIRRHPLGSVFTSGVLAATFMMITRRSPAPPGIRAAIAMAGFSLLRRAAISTFMTRVVWRLWGEAPPAFIEKCNPPNSAEFRRHRTYRHTAKL